MKYNTDIELDLAKDFAEYDELNSEQRLLRDIRRICRLLDDAYLRFQMQADDDLVEASIYEIEALKARYRYLLRLAKSRNISCNTCKTALHKNN